MDPIERMSLQEDIDYYGFDYPPKDSNIELIEVDGLIEIKTPTKDALFNWWE